MTITTEEIKRRKKELLQEKIRNMTNEDAYCPTCNEDGFNTVKTMVTHHNNHHMTEVEYETVCEYCETAFTPTNPHNPNKYCSDSCFGMAEREKTEYVEIECDQDDCDNTRIMLKSAYKSIGAEYCSRSCANKGEAHWAWNGGTGGIRSTPEYHQWRKEIHNSRDDCAECGSTDNLHAHHIVPISENKSLACDVDNGILICGKCHADKHPELSEKLFEK